MRWGLQSLEPEEQWRKLELEEQQEHAGDPSTCNCPMCKFAREDPERFLEVAERALNKIEERKKRPVN